MRDLKSLIDVLVAAITRMDRDVSDYPDEEFDAGFDAAEEARLEAQAAARREGHAALAEALDSASHPTILKDCLAWIASEGAG